MIFIYTTWPKKALAKRVGERLVKKKLAACCNIFPIDSVYQWQGKIEKDKEFVMIIKTKKGNFKKIEKFILENHPDDTPCVIEILINRVSKKYLNWFNKQI